MPSNPCWQCGEAVRDGQEYCAACRGTDWYAHMVKAKATTGRVRAHWWQTPPGHIPYSGRISGSVVFGALTGAMFEHVLNSPWGWLGAIVGLSLAPIGIWSEWREGY
jgi:hypothetical protein